MKLQARIAIIAAAVSFLFGCTTTSAPDILNLQPSQQEQNQAKLDSALVS